MASAIQVGGRAAKTRTYETYRDPDKALRDIRSRIKGRGPYKLKMRGERRYSPERTLPKTMDRVEERLANLNRGEALWIKLGAGRVIVARGVEVMSTRAGSSVPPCPEPSTNQVENIWTFTHRQARELEARFGPLNYVNLGIFNCRTIAGSSTWSQHAWAHALDWALHREQADGGTGKIHMQAMDVVVRRVRERWNCDTQWKVPNHWDHCHTSGCPRKTGTPPCA